MIKPHLAPHRAGARADISDAAARPGSGLPDKSDLEDELDKLRTRIGELQSALGAEGKHALLVVFQGRDASGKDGTVQSVFRESNPALCTVTSFKRPTELELRHDYLWRVHQTIPPRGMVGIFNRSHYEDVLVVRVHQLVPEARWRKRYDHINAFEQLLTDEGVTILKFFLHISREEQRKRLEERLANPAKNWKFQKGDLAERALWDQYTDAYAEMLERTSTAAAPWYVVPGDKNKARDYLVAQVIARALEDLDPQYPPADPEVLKLKGSLT